MYYNKEVTVDKLINGVDDAADHVEDLYIFIEKLVSCTNIEELEKLKGEWNS